MIDSDSSDRKEYFGVYIVSESGCLNPGSGAFKHIQAGLSELNNYFRVELLLFCKPYVSQEVGSSKLSHPQDRKAVKILQWVKRFFKWFYILWYNHKDIFSYYKRVKQLTPDFIYERSSYLNFKGILIAKWLNISHFYEVNGITANDNSRYFFYVYNRMARWLETKAYESTVGFYVGGINDSLNIPKEKAFVIQNGVDREFANIFEKKVNAASGKINLTFIGHAMAHHRLDVIVKALHLLVNPAAFKLHLIGANLETIKMEIPDSVEVICYGSLNQERISELMKEFHVGLIAYALPYFSNVKAFMYGAAKLAVILPSSRNFKEIFSDREVLFIKNADHVDLADKLNTIEKDRHMLEVYGENLYNRICSDFTWEKIYYDIHATILEYVRK